MPVGVIVAAVEASGLSHYEVAKRLGWQRMATDRRYSRPVPRLVYDGDRVRRDLGLRTAHTHGIRSRHLAMSYEKALLFCEALGLDPVDLDL